MYDYLKIDCTDTFYRYWLDNAVLDFPLMVSERTGQILASTRTATEKNLQFKITPSTVQEGHHYCTLSGSLHKYNNLGLHNGDNFYYEEFADQVNSLKTKFDINPTRAEVKTFEFGVNIQLPNGITPRQVIDAVVSMPTRQFVRMNAKKVRLGKIARFTDHEIKIYDKNGQVSQSDLFNTINKIPTNSLRFEFKVSKMRFLEQKRYQLKQPGKPLYLSQLLKRDFIQRMNGILLELFNDIIWYVPRTDMEKTLTDKQIMRILEQNSGNYWATLDNKTRYRQTEIRNKLLEKIETINYNTILGELIHQKTQHLLSGYDQNGVRMHQKTTTTENTKKGTNDPYNCGVHLTPSTPKIKNQNKNTHSKKRYCKHCGRDISNQRAGSKYCSEAIHGKQAKQCRNAATYAKRKSQRQKLIERENKLLEKLTKQPPPKRLYITLNTGQKLRPTIQQATAWPWSQRRKIIELSIKGQKLTRTRAKQYVKFLKGLQQ